MTTYSVYLEIGESGLCMAHIPALPGCIVRAPTRGDALRQLPEAIRHYSDWLRRHDEPALPADEPIQTMIADESKGFGPFDPGDAAALFAPDREPVSLSEMDRYFRLMAHARADLLALVWHLPDDLLDWQLHPEVFSIRQLLRHVGNSEEWYVSRLVPPESLPPEWEGDESLPIFDFLEMERRTAMARLRQLSEVERAAVFQPTHWTEHPDEAWTAHKALRRFLEHELEHTAQVRQILSARRCHSLAILAAERAGLLQQLLGLGTQTLVGEPVVQDWTFTDLLAHVAAWDRWVDRTMRCMAAGESPDFTALQDFDASNAAFVAQWRARTLHLSPDEALAALVSELQAARGDWVSWLESLPTEEFFRPRSYADGDWTFSSTPLRVQWQHDAEHAAQVEAWRVARGFKGETGPKPVLLAALAAAREELLTAAAQTPTEVRDSRPAEGEWTLQEIVGHIADWEWFGVEGLRQMAAGQPPRVEAVEDIDAWNRAHVEARRNQTWDAVWKDLHAARRELVDVLADISHTDLNHTYPFPWGGSGTAYQWLCVWVGHDREHAHGLRNQKGKDVTAGT